MFSLHGTPLGGGIAIGRARRLAMQIGDIARYHVLTEQVEREVERLHGAVDVVHEEFSTLRDSLPETAPEEARALIDIHLMILADPMLVPAAVESIHDELRNAEWALVSQMQKLVAQFDEFEDAYLRERGRDVRQVTDRILALLVGSGRVPVADAGEPLLFVADDIAPADMLRLKHGAGFAIELGGTTSHTAILARSMGVPSVIGVRYATELIRDDDWIVLDGDAGVMICAPDESVLAEYRYRQAKRELERAKLRRLVDVPSRTIDGREIELMANIELPDEAKIALENGAQGIGLFRTEFLFMNRSEPPTEDEQFEAYRSAVVAMEGRPVTIRTLDVGADKALPWAVGPNSVTNPALGLRAIRFSLTHPEMFLSQLRAILRASAHGPVRLLLPMITHAHEIVASLRLIDRARDQLNARREPVAERVPVGGMIEVPAAALSAAHFLQRLDFLSIGTNDLIQYTLAIDRVDGQVAHLYDGFHPSVLRLIANTIDVARKAEKSISVCGEMAGDPRATRLLLGMGLTELSMHPVNLLEVKRQVLLSEFDKLQPPVSRLIRLLDPERVANALQRLEATGGRT
ncbi:MAG: phosphoenolpyruvate--protein phosphotransferase [Burkholderiaceae bacterium]